MGAPTGVLLKVAYIDSMNNQVLLDFSTGFASALIGITPPATIFIRGPPPATAGPPGPSAFQGKLYNWIHTTLASVAYSIPSPFNLIGQAENVIQCKIMS